MTPLLHTSNQPFSPNSSSSIPSISSTSSTSNKDELVIPQHWQPEVEQCIKDKILSEQARNKIIQTMVNLLFTRSRKLCLYDCGSLAPILILVYPFMKDDLGNGCCNHVASILQHFCRQYISMFKTQFCFFSIKHTKLPT